MTKYTTKQLQEAIKALYPHDDKESKGAYAVIFNELCARMGDDECMEWMDTWEAEAYQQKQYATI